MDEAKIRILLKLALKYRVELRDKDYACLVCGSTVPGCTAYGPVSLPLAMERHVREHIEAGELTEKNIFT